MKRFRSWFACLVFACGAVEAAERTATSIDDPAAFLAQTESLRTKDHAEFVRRLEEIHRVSPPMDASTTWYLRYLDAWQTMFSGDYVKSQTALQDIVAHSGDATLAAKASALLLSNFAANRRYAEAFALANQVTVGLDKVTDPLARSMLLMNLSQMLNLAGQADLALRYAAMMEESMPPGGDLCYPRSLRVAALDTRGHLSSTSTDLTEAIETCVSSAQPVLANTMRLVLIDRLLDENQPRKALDLLDHIGGSIRTNAYYPHMLASQVQRARIYEKLDRNDEARKAALAAVAMSDPSDLSEWLRDAYGVLYRIEKASGHSAAALNYYERYTAADKGYLTDLTARSLAFQLSQQHVVVQKLESEQLAKQNNILRLQKALETKALETGRLYIGLLSMFLASVIFWLFRTKRSQLRFRKLSRYDGLTGIFNRQHFMNEAERVLRSMEKRHAPACLLLIDLDHFKQVNDTYGHAMGDVVLRHAATLCQQQLRPADLFGRLGGEEFGVFLPGCPLDEGVAIAERIRRAIELSPAVEDGYTIVFSASVGVAGTEDHGYTLPRVCREADASLYAAKRAGRNRVVANGHAHECAQPSVA